ncbi:hypothetical protein M758_1G094700 [Ceratodon purpureus]|uniref:Uncharacterized protein n=1 Tax=Ceratodon purpureus TaxID=3225 RepID=A0A8T0J3X1_CERPU|nr:hypothetical protein KC19_1G087500 [Ceratodon purpureus]KAG0629328.1 hypothetical protein M758_1G094700 [Ceratodon purpureus]
MEGGLGSTRMGSRSSTRHGPASVFQGRVRRWKKAWAPVAPSTTPSAAACRVLLYKWTPVTVPTTNGAKESTPEEPPPAKPLRFLPVSVVLQQKKEEALKAAEEAEAMARSLQKESESATNATVETDEADAKDTQEDTNMGGTQPEETGATASETNDEAVEGDAQTTRAELAASLQDESTAAPQEPEAASMDVDQSKS